jgi:hypothetical protein
VAATLPPEDRQGGRDAVQQPPDVDVEHPVPLVGQQRVEPGQRHHTGVVDEHVHPPELGDRAVDERRDVRAVGDVETAYVDGVLAFGESRQALLAPGPRDDLMSLPGQPQRDGFADAAARAGDQNDLRCRFHDSTLRARAGGWQGAIHPGTAVKSRSADHAAG